MIHVNFGKMLVACSDPPRAIAETPAFVHRVTGKVLFVKLDDEAAALHFPDVAAELDKLRTAVAASDSWLAVPKHSGRVMDLKDFMLAWCAENGFTTASA